MERVGASQRVAIDRIQHIEDDRNRYVGGDVLHHDRPCREFRKQYFPVALDRGRIDGLLKR